MSPRPDLFDDDLNERFEASIAASEQSRLEVAEEVMQKVGGPRLGTSGAANAFIVIIGSEFGTSGSDSRPVYSPARMGEAGWQELWRLRIGEPNPHFDPRWADFRANTKLWRTLYSWLPNAIGKERLALSTFAWANLSVTSGDRDLGTVATHTAGMDHHVGPLIEASGARVVIATNEPTREQLDRWARTRGGVRFAVADMQAWHVRIGERQIVAAKAGHPSRGHPSFPVSERLWVGRVSSLLRIATGDVRIESEQRSTDPESAREATRSPRRIRKPGRPDRARPPDDVVEHAVAEWERLGGSVEPTPSGYLKLMHPSSSHKGACLVIDLSAGKFDHFANVRIHTLAEWHEVFGEVAYAFDAYAPSERGIKSSGRSSRVECELRPVPDWPTAVSRFLRLCRDHWAMA